MVLSLLLMLGHGGIDLVGQHNGGKMQKQKFVIWMLIHL